MDEKEVDKNSIRMDLYNKFIEELVNSKNNGSIVTCTIPSLKKFLIERNNRLKRLNIKEEYTLDTKSKDGVENNYVTVRMFDEPDRDPSSKFDKFYYIKGYRRNKIYKYNDIIIYQKNNYITFTTMIYDIFDKTDYNQMTCNCPNCNSINTVVKFVEKGCEYCGTKFLVKNLFPRVFSYNTKDQIPNTTTDNKKFMKNIILFLGMMFFLVTFILKMVLSTEIPLPFRLFDAFSTSIFSFIISIFFSAPIATIIIFIKLSLRSISTYDKSYLVKDSRKEIVENLKKYIPNFNYDFFENDLASTIKEILISDNRENILQYECDNIDPRFNNIVDVTYRQKIVLDKISIIEDDIVMKVKIYLLNEYFYDEKIDVRQECLSLTMKHKLNCDVNTELVLNNLKCKNCGSSFDGFNNKVCSYCNSKYVFEEDIWVITAIEG